jgi:hypothetical protein
MSLMVSGWLFLQPGNRGRIYFLPKKSVPFRLSLSPFTIIHYPLSSSDNSKSDYQRISASRRLVLSETKPNIENIP